MTKNIVSIEDLIAIDVSILKVGVSLPFDLYNAKGKLLSTQHYAFKSEQEIKGVAFAKPMRLKTEDDFLDKPAKTLLEERPSPNAPQAIRESKNDPELRDLKTPINPENSSNAQSDNSLESASAAAMVNELIELFPKLYRAFQSKSNSALDLLANMEKIIFELIAQDIDAAIGVLHMTPIKSQAEHCVFTAILAAIYSKTLGYPERFIRLVTTSALCMNLGAIKLHHELNLSNAVLSDEKLAEIRQHSEASKALLANVGIRHPTIINAILHHHERPDGSGYPAGLHSPEIPDEALIIGIVDTYLAMIGPRAYREKTQPKDALKQVLFEGHKYDNDFYTCFIKAIGVFPAGTFHKLSDGKVVVVTRRDPLYSTRPEICILLDAKGHPVSPLIRQRLFEMGQTIKAPFADSQSLNISPNQLWN